MDGRTEHMGGLTGWRVSDEYIDWRTDR